MPRRKGGDKMDRNPVNGWDKTMPAQPLPRQDRPSDVVLTAEEAEFVSSHTDDKVIRLLQKAGLSPEQAKKAVKARY